MNEVAVISGMVDELLAEATVGMEMPDGWDGEENLQAAMAKRALAITVERKETLRSAQMLIVARVAREKLYLAHHPTTDYPDGYGSLHEFLVDSGVKGSVLSNLRTVGDILIPFADKHGLGVDDLMTNSLRPKLVYALPALRASVAQDNVGGFNEVIGDVRTFPHREAIGAKYHTPRARRGQGSTLRTPDNRALVVLVLDNETYVQDIIQRLAGSIKWGLPMQLDTMGGHKIEVTIYDPEEDS
jgi:hypothetical protein